MSLPTKSSMLWRVEKELTTRCSSSSPRPAARIVEMYSLFRLPGFLFLLALIVSSASACGGGTTPTPALDPNIYRFSASQDATLYEHAAGELASSAGTSNFVGVTNQYEIRRMLLAFDLTSLPANREVINVTLQMRMSKSASGPFDVAMHRVTTPWGEGASSASSNTGGKGSTSSAGDPTWVHAVYPDTAWSNSGGDHVAQASAVTRVDNFVRYVWSDPGLVQDVRLWASGEKPNFGWLIIGDESNQKTAKRFDSREHSDLTRRPFLLVELAPIP